MYLRLIGIIVWVGSLNFLMSYKYETIKILTPNTVHHLKVEIADSQQEKQRGLMHREFLPDNTGMLFVYGPNSHPIMWMKNMLISLDILFIGEDLKINYIEKEAPPCQLEDDYRCPRYVYPYPSSYILELPAGYTSGRNIRVGDQLELNLGIE